MGDGIGKYTLMHLGDKIKRRFVNENNIKSINTNILFIIFTTKYIFDF